MSDLLAPTNTIQTILSAEINASAEFVAEHIFLYIESGSLSIHDGSKESTIQSGHCCLIKRNSIVKFTRSPAGAENHKIIEIRLHSGFLKVFAEEFGYSIKEKSPVKGRFSENAIINLKSDKMLQKSLESRLLYEKMKGGEREHLLNLQNKELVLILINLYHELQLVLFDFTEPQKADLKDYMNLNYKYNLSLNQFGYLTGRSLTSFKRDFEKVFDKAPGRWLLDKRLNEARILIEKDGKKPTDVYLEVGFEDLSHFSYAFKKAFGASPNKLLNNIKSDDTR